MLKSILIFLIGLFFFLNGVNHIFNTKMVARYAERRGFKWPRLMVYISGVALLLGGTALMINFLVLPAIYGLSAFLVISALSIHRFWEEHDAEGKMLESMNFVKNLAIMVELLYIGFS